MKKILLALIVLTSVNAFSQVIYLDQTDINLGSNSATLVKTATSPSFITLRLMVPTTMERCHSNDYMRVTDGALCGYDEVPRRCAGGGYYGPNIGFPRTGPHYRPPMGGPRPMPRPRPGTSIPAGRRYNPTLFNGAVVFLGSTTCGFDSLPRTCTVCSRPYYETVDVSKTFNLEFEKFDQEATIEFSLDQYGNLILDVSGVNPSCVKKVIYGSGKDMTGAKMKLKRSCR